MERLELEFYYGQEAEQFTFYRLPKALITDSRFKDISNNAKLLYGLMLDRMGLSARSGWFDEENRVYIKYSVKSIMEDLNCSKMTAVGLLKELQAIGLIDMVQRSALLLCSRSAQGGTDFLTRWRPWRFHLSAGYPTHRCTRPFYRAGAQCARLSHIC